MAAGARGRGAVRPWSPGQEGVGERQGGRALDPTAGRTKPEMPPAPALGALSRSAGRGWLPHPRVLPASPEAGALGTSVPGWDKDQQRSF